MNNYLKIIKSPPIVFGLIFTAFCLLLLFKLSVTGDMRHSQADDLIEIVMKNWLAQDYVFNYDLWEDYYKTPPIHSITDFKILDKKYYKKRGDDFADYLVILDFPAESFLPSKKIWHAILIRTIDGWRVRDFAMNSGQKSFQKTSKP